MTLWAVHVEGPDDVLAAASEAAAIAEAEEINAYFARRAAEDPSPYDPTMSAKVIGWPFSPERHAKSLAEQERERVEIEAQRAAKKGSR